VRLLNGDYCFLLYATGRPLSLVQSQPR